MFGSFGVKQSNNKPKHLEVIQGGVELPFTIRNSDYENKSRLPSNRARGIISDQEQFEVLKRLPSAQPKTGGFWMACCPAHDDKTPSLQFDYKDDKLSVKCYAGCEFETILAKAGIKNEPQPKKATSKKAKKKAIIGEVEFRTYAEVKPEPVEWLVHDWLALGEICIFAGEPAKGKTTIATKLASIVSKGVVNGGMDPRLKVERLFSMRLKLLLKKRMFLMFMPMVAILRISWKLSWHQTRNQKKVKKAVKTE